MVARARRLRGSDIVRAMALGSWVARLVLPVLVTACSDDGVPATTDLSSDSATNGGSATAAETTGADPTGATMTTSASLTDSDTQSDVTGPSGTSAVDTSDTDPAGTSSTGEGTGAESSTGEPATSCAAPSDCMIVEDCCSCLALPAGAEPPKCDMQCDQSACSALGLEPVVQCELGSCEFVPLPCNPFEVSCESEPPDCQPGMLPGVDPDQACWTGDCVPAEHCDVVPSCADCPDDEVCVQRISQIPSTTCSPIPEACDGQPSCACMGADVCVSPFDVCGDDGDGLSCACPAC